MDTKKYNFVKVDDFYVIIDEPLVIKESFPFHCIEKLVDGTYQMWQVDNPNDLDLKNQYEIIATTKKFKGIPTFQILEFDALTAKKVELKLSDNGYPKIKRGNKVTITKWLYDEGC